MTLYIATSNPGKLRDFATAAANLISSTHPAPEILPLPSLADIPAPDETEPTFLGNATLKALFYSRHAPGQTVLADDSGLEVDALNGAPGVRSARYADDHALSLTLSSNPDDLAHRSVDEPHRSVDERNNHVLLLNLSQFPSTKRHARYRCVLVAARDGVVLATAHGTVEGQILPAPRGTGGFGYDPLFYLPDLDRTMAELDSATRLSLSHRGRALRNLLPLLQS